MDDFRSIWEAVPIRHDWISYFMVIGVGLAFMIIFTIMSRWKSSTSPTKILAAILICISITIFDIFLGYTGLMKFTLAINNFSESFVVLCIPLVFLLLKSIIEKDNIDIRKIYGHLLIPLCYLLYQIILWFKPIESKLHDYIIAYHPSLYLS